MILRRLSPVVLSLTLLLTTLTSGCSSHRLVSPVKQPNVVVITVDSQRTDRLQLWNPDAVAETPNLDLLAARGTVFKNTWAVTPWTAPSVVSVFTGLFPPSHGVIHRDDTTPDGLPTLATLLAERDYRIGNFSFFSNLSYYRGLGFDQPQKSLAHRHATSMFRRWAARDKGTPFMAWIHLIEPHLPYGSSGYQSRSVTIHGSSGLERSQLRADVPVGSVEFNEGDRESLLHLYDLDVAEMDKAIGSIQQTLDGLELTESTIVVFIADHGEELLDRGWIGHASTAVEAKLIPETLHIPLIMAGPGITPGALSDALVQHVDVLPTLLELLHVPAPNALDGDPIRFLRDAARGRRKLAFFDSSAGGNLTPRRRRNERWQGISDGSCLITAHSTPGATEYFSEPLTDQECGEAEMRRLRRELERWQEKQIRQRIHLIGDLKTLPPPPAAEVELYAEDLRAFVPLPGSVVEWAANGGILFLQWEPTGASCWVEYKVGHGVSAVDGAFPVEGDRIEFGPFPEGFWGDLADHNPYRYRVFCPELERRSPWLDFSLSSS